MSWFSSIHVATNERDLVIENLKGLNEGRFFVGKSGDRWIGVYSQKCEESGGVEVPKLASKISGYFDHVVFGICTYEDEFACWLYLKDKLIDRYPVGKIKQLFSGRRRILDLAIDSGSRRLVESALETRRTLPPNKLKGVSEAEFIAEASRDLARIQTMTPAERERMMEKYSRYRSDHEERLKTLCESIGIREYYWNYSDFLNIERLGADGRPSLTMDLIHL